MSWAGEGKEIVSNGTERKGRMRKGRKGLDAVFRMPMMIFQNAVLVTLQLLRFWGQTLKNKTKQNKLILDREENARLFSSELIEEAKEEAPITSNHQI